METYQAINKRASIRRYQQKPVTKDLIEQLVDAARMAPTARGVEPWEFVVIADKGVLKRIADMAPNATFIQAAACAIVVICEDTKYYLEDGCAATENILIAASDLGLGACWIAGDKKPYCEEILSMVNAPANKKLVSIVSLGWPAEETLRHRRRSITDLLHWDKF
jgi:nitroreductase